MLMTMRHRCAAAILPVLACLSVAGEASAQTAAPLFAVGDASATAAQEPEPPPVRIEWRDGKTRITADQAYLELSNRIQVRYTHEFPDGSVQLPGTAAPGDARGSFRIRRAKFKFEGWLWRKNLTYEVQMNWPGAASSNPGSLLEDAYLGFDPEGEGRFRVFFGQMKVPFGHQEMTSSGSQQFVDRSLVSNEYARGRDTGVAVQGVLFGNRLEYRAGVFNGNGQTRSANDNSAFQYNARLMWQPNGSQNLVHRGWVSGALYSEGDFESKDVPIYAFGVNLERNDFHRTTAGNDLRSTIVGLDGVFKFRGLYGAAELYWRTRTPEEGSAFDSNGWFVQGGQMLNAPRTVEAAFRYGRRDVTDAVADDQVSELRGGINYYYRRHALKLQADVGRVETELGPGAGTRDDYEVRVQTQFIF